MHTLTVKEIEGQCFDFSVPRWRKMSAIIFASEVAALCVLFVSFFYVVLIFSYRCPLPNIAHWIFQNLQYHALLAFRSMFSSADIFVHPSSVICLYFSSNDILPRSRSSRAQVSFAVFSYRRCPSLASPAIAHFSLCDSCIGYQGL